VLLCVISTDAEGIGYRGVPHGSPHPNCLRLTSVAGSCALVTSEVAPESALQVPRSALGLPRGQEFPAPAATPLAGSTRPTPARAHISPTRTRSHRIKLGGAQRHPRGVGDFVRRKRAGRRRARTFYTFSSRGDCGGGGERRAR